MTFKINGSQTAAKSGLSEINQNKQLQNTQTRFQPDQSVRQMNQKVGNGLTAQTQADSKDFRVEKSTDSKKLRDELLTEHFFYTPEDIKAYEAKYGEFVINDEKSCAAVTSAGKPCTWATPADIKNWRVENGKVSISLSAETVKSLQNFRQERIIDNAVNNISDPALRNQVRNDLLQVATGEGQEKIAAANRLMYPAKGSELDLNVARQAVKTVAAQPENRNNPLTNLTAAKVTLDDAIKREDIKGVSDAEWQMNKAVKLVQGQDVLTGEYRKDAKVNRAEAAWVNRQVSINLRSIGRNAEAFERETLARYYEADDAERSKVYGYPLGEIDRWQKTDTPSMRPVSQAETDWQEFQDAYSEEPQMKKRLGESKFKYEWKVPKFIERSILEVGGTPNKPVIKETSLEREKLSGSLRVTGITTVETKVNILKNGRIRSPKLPYYGKEEYFRNNASYQRTMQSPELNQNGINRGIGAARGVDLLGVINSNVPFYADLYYGKTEKIIALRNQLEKADKLATKYPVPPKPEDLPKERERLLRTIGGDTKGKILVNEIMRELEIKSHAFWNR